jgi:Acetyltransferase (GNAT) family
MRLDAKLVRKIIRHAVSEFTKHGLGVDYYGYHNIDHELEVAYITLVAANGQKRQDHKFSQKDLITLFIAALFHDYDPLKRFDKPHEDSVESFIRNDGKIKRFIDDLEINIDIVIALIYRTAYPFKGIIADQANKRIQELFTSAGISDNDITIRKHYEELGWFLSISDRIAGYCLGNFEHSKELARRNVHSLGWHPALINEESVKYFSALKEEKEMVERVLEGLPDEYRKNFFDNVEAFKESWEKEVNIRNSIRRKELSLISAVDKIEDNLDAYITLSIQSIHRDLPAPIRLSEEKFMRSLSDSNTILITLRIEDGNIVGYVKGGPLENYKLRSGTRDENWGKKNTAYMEWISIKPGYWGETGGHLLRLHFLQEARRRGYRFVTSYVHRNVIIGRINRGERIMIVQKYDPDRLDYYRTDLISLVLQYP